MMLNKLKHFFQEAEIKTKVIAIIVLLIIIVVEISVIHNRNRFLVELLNKPKEVVKEVPAPRMLVKEELILQGTTARGGIPYALINDEIYTEGDMLEGYKIIEITMESTILKNVRTNELKKLFFPYLFE